MKTATYMEQPRVITFYASGAVNLRSEGLNENMNEALIFLFSLPLTEPMITFVVLQS